MKRCSNPIEAGVLAEYWRAALATRDEEAVEEHLFRCDECGQRLREVIALAEGIRRLAREGSLRMFVSDAFLKRAAEDGMRVRQYTVEPGGRVECTVTAEDDILIGRLAANLSAVPRVDFCMCDETGVERLRLEDVPVDAGTGDVIFQESIAYAKAMPSGRLIVRLVGFDEGGSERPLGEYTFNHTRSLPGPGGW